MTFTITANVLGATTLTLELEKGENSTVEDVKVLVETLNPSSPRDVQMVVYAGKRLEDEKTLKSYGITNGVKLFIGVSPNKIASKSPEKKHEDAVKQMETQQGVAEEEETKPTMDGLELNCFVVGKGKKKIVVPGGVNTTVEDLSKLIEKHYPDQPADTQILAVNGKKLVEGTTLGSCGVLNGQTVYVGRKPGVNSSNPTITDEDLRGEETIISDLMAALAKIKAHVQFDEFVVAMKKLSILLGNLIDHPEDPKFRRIRTENATLQRALFKHEGGLDAIKALGYRESTEEPNTYFVKQPSAHLPKVRKMLVDAFKQQGIPLPQPSLSPSSSSQQQQQQPSPSSFPSFPGLGSLGSLGNMPDMSQDPMMQAILSNPQLMESMMPQIQQMMSNPAMMQQMMGQMQGNPAFANNPMMQQMMNNPAAMEQMRQAASMMAQNPGMMQQMMQSMRGQGQQQQTPLPNPFQQQQQQVPNSFGNAMIQSEEAMIEEAIRRSLQDQGGINSNNNNNNENDNNNNDEEGNNNTDNSDLD
eukprot:m.79478 g.79478  ORF g.79478 m.79478 type:complete len:529 (-) comp8605_c1_seq3:1522-3108(-)